MSIRDLSVKEYGDALRKKEFSAEEGVKEFLAAIQKEDGEIRAFLSLCEDEATERARAVDEKLARGETLHALAGVPIAVKDNILIRGGKATAASRMLENYVSAYDASVIRNLKDCGALFIGKTNLDEFAMGASTENSAFGPTKNPHDVSRVPGGSSGGSAAAVAARLAPAALGTDTGGSIKQPAAFCGVVGLRPTYGAVSRYGVIALTSSLDQVGSLAKTVADVRTVFEVIAGRDPYDATSVETVSKEPKELKSLRIGIPKEYFSEGLDPEIAARVKKVGEFLEKQGATVQEVSLPHTGYGLAVYYIITPSEASSNLARFDGIRYGVRVENSSIEELVSRSRGKGFGSEPKRRIILGTFALSSGYADQYYLRAVKVRSLIAQDFERAFEKVDLLLTPTAPTVAFKIGEKKDPLSMYLSDIFTIPANLAGLPGLSVPAGTVKNLPVGVQLLGPKFSENMLFEVGEAIEKEKWF